MSSPDHTGTDGHNPELQQEANERALTRAAFAATTIQLRLFHGLVPVMSELIKLEILLQMLRDSCFFRRQHAAIAIPFVDSMATSAREATREIRQRADELGYPLDQEVKRFQAVQATIGTLDQMRKALSNGDEPDWDTWLRGIS